MTDKEAKHFYNSKEWKKKRIDILIRDRNECQDCIVRIRKAVEEGIRLTPEDRKVRRATEVHHIQELKEHPELVQDDWEYMLTGSVCVIRAMIYGITDTHL